MEPSKLNILSRRADTAISGTPPVLLVHGAWHGAWCWQGNFLEYFAEQGFDTYAMDLRGHGQSPARKAMRWNRMTDYVDDILSVVEGFEQPPFVIGHSMGGFACQHLMTRTKHLSGIGLLATVPHYGAIKATLKIAKSRPLDFLKANARLSLYPLVSDPLKAAHMFLDEDTAEPDRIEFGKKMIDESYMAFLDMLVLKLPRKPISAVPVVVVGGARDGLFSPASQRATAGRYGAQCHILAETAHDVMLSENWLMAAETVRDWMYASK
ncbi:alpha/beta fold hydrolase [Pseudooceanicola sp.]|uniref:alpha/beta hydrolase n=1 Tax=Pseudooceanicola sp. TaxID=1914328 RepID=UPI0026016568|nr:alpha/beta fold hydrolase [Pseudooceanicola sp.]MDF1856052.1 alpha/beta fold hydrolase [Pseudooceanicola sp.]